MNKIKTSQNLNTIYYLFTEIEIINIYNILNSNEKVQNPIIFGHFYFRIVIVTPLIILLRKKCPTDTINKEFHDNF